MYNLTLRGFKTALQIYAFFLKYANFSQKKNQQSNNCVRGGIRDKWGMPPLKLPQSLHIPLTISQLAYIKLTDLSASLFPSAHTRNAAGIAYPLRKPLRGLARDAITQNTKWNARTRARKRARIRTTFTIFALSSVAIEHKNFVNIKKNIHKHLQCKNNCQNKRPTQSLQRSLHKLILPNIAEREIGSIRLVPKEFSLYHLKIITINENVTYTVTLILLLLPI